MATYAIGDVQGCFESLTSLLTKINFDDSCDQLWFTGDLVNRGPQSLETLRFVYQHRENIISVLGNHDLHLLARYYGVREKNNDTLDEVLTAPDADELMHFLLRLPLLHTANNFCMSHAGIAPLWSIAKAKALAAEAEHELQHDTKNVLREMYGNEPDLWQENLTGYDRLRCIINYFTRMRYCYADGRLDFFCKKKLSKQPPELIPWFILRKQIIGDHDKIIFGHWAALEGITQEKNIFALDTGCVWGNCLSAMRLEDGAIFSVKC